MPADHLGLAHATALSGGGEGTLDQRQPLFDGAKHLAVVRIGAAPVGAGWRRLVDGPNSAKPRSM
jgi:hypothetical protein